VIINNWFINCSDGDAPGAMIEKLEENHNIFFSTAGNLGIVAFFTILNKMTVKCHV
jgi:hypothetical protein